jgi:hypothetical protein
MTMMMMARIRMIAPVEMNTLGSFVLLRGCDAGLGTTLGFQVRHLDCAHDGQR